MQRLFNTAYNTGICCNATPPSCLGMFFASHASYQTRTSFFSLLILLFRTALAPREYICAYVLPLFVCIVTICIDIFLGVKKGDWRVGLCRSGLLSITTIESVLPAIQSRD